MSGSNKVKTAKLWTLKIFFITLILSAGMSVVAQFLTESMPIYLAALVLIIIILLGVVFDIVGMAFSTCEIAPFVAMASKKNKSAKRALKLLKNAAAVSNFCNDVVGDICGIVSGAAGVAIVTKILVSNPTANEAVLSIAFSAVIAAATVALKSLGKSFAMNNNKQIVSMCSKVLSVFDREKKR